MRKITTILIIFTFVFLGIRSLQNSFSQAAQAAPLAPTGNGWQIETAGIGNYDVVTGLQMALDNNDIPHVFYTDGGWSGTAYPTYLKRGNGFWLPTQYLDSNIAAHGTARITIDSSDSPMVSYLNGNELKLGRWSGSDWQFETVNNFNLGSDGEYTWVLDDNDNIRLVYYDSTALGLIYAYQDGSNWITETVANGYLGGSSPSLALDSNGNPLFSYDRWVDGLFFARRMGGIGWITETIDVAGEGSSLALDSSDTPHIMYQDPVSGTLRYAHKSGPTWQIEIVDDSEYINGFPSFSIDSNDYAHVSYFGPGTIKYTFNKGEGWLIETIANDVNQFSRSVLRLNRNDQPFIVYSDGTSKEINLAYNASTTTIIGSTGGTFMPNKNASFTFPIMAFIEAVTLTHTSLLDPIASSMVNMGIYYELTAVSTTTGQPAQLEPGETFTTVVQYDEANLPPGVSESSLGLYYAVNSPAQQPNSVTATWNPASSSVVNTETNEITAVDNHLGVWAVFSEETNTSGYEVYLPAVINP